MTNTCRMPVVSLIAWEDRQAAFIFVRVPTEYGRYMRTDKSVALAPCERCNSTVGEPCKGWRKDNASFGKYHAATHAVRRRAADGRMKRAERPDDIIDRGDGATVTIKDGQG